MNRSAPSSSSQFDHKSMFGDLVNPACTHQSRIESLARERVHQ